MDKVLAIYIIGRLKRQSTNVQAGISIAQTFSKEQLHKLHVSFSSMSIDLLKLFAAAHRK